MNIYLIPYTWTRHFALAIHSATSGLLAWWLALMLSLHPLWGPSMDGPIYLGLLAAFTAGQSFSSEGGLYRHSILWTLPRVVGGALLALAIFAIGQAAWMVMLPLALNTFHMSDLDDPTLSAFRLQLAPFLAAGAGVGLATAGIRKLKGAASHLVAGLTAGMLAGTAWEVLGNFTYFYHSLYIASAIASVVFSSTFGLLAWGIPDTLYAGWLRVLTDTRYGARIPVDGPEGEPRERFIGHYPRGLDIFLPAEEGVAELHVSVLVTPAREYVVRGLTLQPTNLRQFLKRIALHYDPRRSTPLEAPLEQETRLHLGDPANPTVVEFLMLPREER